MGCSQTILTGMLRAILWKNNKAQAIRFSTLDALCREPGCQPGDLLEYTPGRD